MKVLLVRFSSIGDIVLTSPVIRCMRQQIKDLELHVLTKASFRELYTLNPAVDKVYCIEKRLHEVMADLEKENYHHIVDLHRNLRSIGLRLRLRIPASTYPKLNLRKFLLVMLKLDFLPDRHIVDRYFDAVKNLGVINDGKGLDFFLRTEDEVVLNDLPKGFSDGYIAVVVGGKHTTKILPAEKVAAVIGHLHYPVVLLGGPEDRSRGELIRAMSSGNVLNACGTYTLRQSASLLKQAKSVITNDTGLMHIAAAFGKKIISVWGNTVPQLGMYPYLPEGAEPAVIAEVKGLNCRPCSKIGFARCPKEHFRCMFDQDEAEIAKAAMQAVLKNGR